MQIGLQEFVTRLRNMIKQRHMIMRRCAVYGDVGNRHTLVE
jgi:hypothetical protein